MRSVTWFLKTAAVSLVVMPACSSEGVAPKSDPLDLTSLLAEMTGPSSGGALSAGPLAAAGGRGAGLSGCVYSSASASFICNPVTKNGLTITRSFTLLDVNGNPLSQPVRGAVAVIRQNIDVAGTTTRSASRGGAAVSGSATVRRHQTTMLTGIGTNRRVLNGWGTSSISGSMTRNGVTRAISESGVDTLLNVTTSAATRGTPGWPLSGSLVRVATRTRAGDNAQPESHIVRQQVTFNGTSVVTITMTTPSGTRTCTRDLSTKTPPSCSG